MQYQFLRLAIGAVIVLGVALSGSTAADAQSVMKLCGDQWKAAKATGTTNGQTWPQFLARCRAQQSGAAPAAPTYAPAPAEPPQTYGQAAGGAGKTASQCDAEYAANKAAIRASGQTKRAFVASCRAGNETIPQGTAAAPPPSYSQPAAPGPAPTPVSLPTPVPSPPPVPTSETYSSAPVPMGAGEFISDQQARAHCPSDTVVWVNTRSRVYHFSGTHNYGHTKEGAYMCEADAKAAGDRAAMNENHP
jgi:hypothetical protein